MTSFHRAPMKWTVVIIFRDYRKNRYIKISQIIFNRRVTRYRVRASTAGSERIGSLGALPLDPAIFPCSYLHPHPHPHPYHRSSCAKILTQSSQIRLSAMSSVYGNMQLVFFDLETTGLDNNAEVLQIAMRSDSSECSQYVMPRKPIPPKASRINKLTVRNGELYHNGTEKLPTVTRRVAMVALLQYLRQFGYPCVLIAHNCPFDCRFLIPMIVEECLENEFAGVIAGFTDTLNMLGQKFPERRYKNGQLTLKTLATELSLPTEGSHDARYDVYLLQEVAYSHFTKMQLVQSRTRFANALRTLYL